MNMPFSLGFRSSLFLVTFLLSQSAASAQTAFVSLGDVWKYQNSGEPPSTSWNTLEYDDSNWASGPAELGYGDGDEMTVTDGATTAHRTTTYFRRVFSVTDAPNYSSLTLSLLRDDGAVVYLNGVELVRDNMASGAITPSTTAVTTVGGEDEKAFHDYLLPASALKAGLNVIAVEVHQASLSSSDMSFNLRLGGITGNYPVVRILATDPDAIEPGYGTEGHQGSFTVSRSGSLESALTVYLRTDGNAVPGSDYQEIPTQVVIEAGKESAVIKVAALPDLLTEPVENVVLRISPPPTTANSSPYLISPDAAQATVYIHDSAIPIVSLSTVTGETTEPGPTIKITPGRIALRRTGNTTKDLTVYLHISGTATPESDYERIAEAAVIPAGSSELQIFVTPIDDSVSEGDETVLVEFAHPPFPFPPPYTESTDNHSARVVIHDNDPATTASIEITAPAEGAVYSAGATITIMATAIDPKGYIGRVEFYDGDNKIGVSEIAFLVPPDPGTPIHHAFEWKNASVGAHTISARAVDSSGNAVVSKPVHISVLENTLPVVSLVSTRSVTSEPSPNALVAPGIFLLSRTGSTDRDLTVYISYGGTATKGVDYKELPQLVKFPAGNGTVELQVLAIDDSLVEGEETVIAELTAPPFAAIPQYTIDPEHHADKVLIRDNDSAGSATLNITQPHEGDVFKAGSPITITAVAVDPNGYISRVEFYDGENEIGVSEIAFFRAPDPGTPITHTFVWNNPSIGEHSLTARAKDTLGKPVVSPAVHIKVEGLSGAPIVRIVATDPEATELPPNVDAFDPATFTVYRDGNNSLDTLVFYSVHGTAKNGGDYQEIPTTITIPAGKSSATIQIIPLSDMLTVVEPMETVGIRLEPSPLVGPRATYEIDPSASEAAAVIYEQKPPEKGALELAIPTTGEHYPAGSAVDILAAGVSPVYGVRLVEFFADGEKIGQSEDFTKSLKSVYAHSFTWTNPPVGIHSLQARATQPDGTVLASSIVQVTIEGDSGTPVVSVRFLPDLTERPWPNADFAPGSIEVRRTGSTDQPLTVFYGVSGSATPGEDYKELPGTIEIPVGQAVTYLQVEAIDDLLVEGEETVVITVVHPPQPVGDQLSYPDYLIDPDHRSAAITILDNDSNDSRPVLSIEAADHDATEPKPDATVDNATFVIKRVSGPNIPVTAVLGISGTGQNGVDYQEIPNRIQIPVDVKSVEVVIKPLPDNLVEGDESVEIHLIPLICDPAPGTVPGPDCYIADPTRIARAVIHDSSGGGNHLPKVAIVRPVDGSVFLVGNPIEIRVESADSDGTIDHLVLMADGQILTTVNGPALTYTWNTVSEGQHTLVARAVDNAGGEGRSSEVRILVRRPELMAFVHRELPGAYTPGIPFKVELRAEPPGGTQAYAIEDRPPAGWQVSEISNEGVFDPATGKVKFGPYFDAQPRTLTYRLLPPATATGRKEFGGSSSINGAVYPIVGDRIIESVNPTHPADTNQDKSIVLGELTAYAAAWKQGHTWPSGPSPIPMNFVTRAAMIWRHGEAYVFDPSQGAPPLCWVPANQPGSPVNALGIASTERSASGDCSPGVSSTVHLTVSPSATVSSYAVEERIPAGWIVSNISNEGVFDPTTSVIRWGLFLDNTSRTLQYTITPPANVASIGHLGGSVSFDGVATEISGSARMVATDGTTTVHLDRCDRDANGDVTLQLSGAAGQIGTLESSTDLVNWTELKTVFLPDGVMTFSDDSNEGLPNRYYRLKVR
jgi:hypothetical protein